MNGTMGNHDVTLGQVLEAIERMSEQLITLNDTSQQINTRLGVIEGSLDTVNNDLQAVKDDAVQFSNTVEKATADIDVIKGDVIRLEQLRSPSPAPDNQPIVPVEKPAIVQKPEPKTETIDEKEDKNAV
jgi:chromosome segregation ATPase